MAVDQSLEGNEIKCKELQFTAKFNGWIALHIGTLNNIPLSQLIIHEITKYTRLIHGLLRFTLSRPTFLSWSTATLYKDHSLLLCASIWVC